MADLVQSTSEKVLQGSAISEWPRCSCHRLSRWGAPWLDVDPFRCSGFVHSDSGKPAGAVCRFGVLVLRA